MWAPGKNPASTESHVIAASIDLSPTLVKLAGANPPGDRVNGGMLNLGGRIAVERDIKSMVIYSALSLAYGKVGIAYPLSSSGQGKYLRIQCRTNSFRRIYAGNGCCTYRAKTVIGE